MYAIERTKARKDNKLKTSENTTELEEITMNTDFIKNLNDKAKESMEPISKIGNLFSSSIQETLSFQMESAKKYSELVNEQIEVLRNSAGLRNHARAHQRTNGRTR